MNRKLPKIFFIMLLTAAAALTAQALPAWMKWAPENGVQLRQGYHVEWARGGEERLEGTNAGEVAFVWSDCRTGDRGVYMQVIDTQGNLKFPTNGLFVIDADNRQEDPAVWPSNDGGWYVSWVDFDIDSIGDIYCTKVDADGHRLWGGNDPHGLAVCNADGVQNDMRIVDDLQGGCIIAWHDERGGDSGNLYAQHILANGTIDPRWQRNGIAIVNAVGAQITHTADVDGQGGMIIGWKDGRLPGNFDIWAQRVTPQGTLEWGHGQGIQVCAQAANQEAPKVCPDGAGGAFFTWIDDRNINQGNEGKDVYAQRVRADGTLMWDPAGEAVCTNDFEQSENRIINNRSGEAIILWDDKRENGLTTDIYAQRISGTSHLRKEWQNYPQGVPVVTEIRDEQQGRLFADGQGGAYYAWEDERDGGNVEIDIWAQRINLNGQPLWQENGVPVCRIPGTQNAPLIRRTADGGCVMAWGDFRSGGLEVWAQRLNGDGQPQWDINGIPLVQGIDNSATLAKTIYKGNGYFTVFWQDGRSGTQVPYLQSVHSAGDHPDTLFTRNGIPAITGTIGGGQNPDGCSDESGGTILVWEDHRVGDIYSIYAQRMNGDGHALWDTAGHKVAESLDGFEQSKPRVCTDGANGAIIAWQSASIYGDNDIFMQRLDANGAQMWGVNGIIIANQHVPHNREEEIEQLISDGHGGAVVSWKLTTTDADQQINDNLYATRVNPDGQKLWNGDLGGITICDARGNQGESQLIIHPTGYVMVWVDGRDDFGDGQPGNDIYGQFIEPDGTIRWQPNGSRICGWDEHQTLPVVAVDRWRGIWVAWEDLRNSVSTGTDIYMQKINQYPDSLGNLVVYFHSPRDSNDVDGVPVCKAATDQNHPEIISDGNGGVWMAWEDNRGGSHCDLYGTHLDQHGRPYPLWQIDGNPICHAFHKQQNAQLVTLAPLYSAGGCAVLWEDKRSTGKAELSNLYIQLLDPAPEEVSDNTSKPLPTGYSLAPVYPNPFNSRAVVSFAVPRAGNVKVAIFDATGRLVRELSNGFQTAGVHKVAIDGEALASGSYIVRLESQDTRLEQAFQLLK